MNKKALSVSLLVGILVWSVSVAQTYDFTQKIPVDTAIHIGKLPNGITYYIKKNQKPEKRMELRLAVNAGSVLEDTDQLGLAHFTEHMAFNGTKHFAKNELVSYLQSVGVKFGADLNAYTGFDETVYMLMLPTDKPELVEKGFQVLDDWAQGITFDSTEIEKERGVVIEEWRLHRGADQRMQDKFLPVIFHKSRYAERLPIGTLESLEKFKRNQILRFYNDWYRPDLMAVVAVGDFDVAEVEKQIKEHFSSIQAKSNTRKREQFDLPSHKETLISINSDKEATNTTVSVYYKSSPIPEVFIGDYVESAKKQLYFIMLNQRIEELTRLAQPPFINAYSYYGNISCRSKYAYVSEALVSDTGIITGLKTVLTENERVQKFGFTQGEFERAKKQLVKMYEKYYEERDKSESEQFASEYIRNFMTNEPIPGISFEFNIIKQCLPNVNLNDINALANKWITDSNRVIVVTAPLKDGLKLPTEDQLLATVDQISRQTTEAYVDKLTSTELLDNKPVAGKIIQEKTYKEINTTEFVLSNGVKVILKPTDFKNDEILLSAISKGGQSLYPVADHFSARFANDIMGECGVGKFSATDLQKTLSGKTVSLNPFINMYSEGFKGTCVPTDKEAMFQLIYLYFTQARFDDAAYQSFSSRVRSYLKNLESNPQVYYQDQSARIMSQNHPRGGGVPKESDIDKINPKRVFEIFKDRFSDASDFTFTLVGNFNIDEIKPLLELYLGRLPSKNSKENYIDLGIRPPSGELHKDLFKGTDPKSNVSITFTNAAKYSQEDAFLLKLLSDVMNIRLIEVLREEKSGVYGVGASASMTRIPYESYNISIKFPCAPNNVDSLVKQAINIGKEIQENGISELNLTKVKETQEREFEVNIKTNGYWLNSIENAWFYNENPLDILKKKDRILKATSKEIQGVAQKYLKNEYIKIALYPQK
jgi:zinc protease